MKKKGFTKLTLYFTDEELFALFRYQRFINKHSELNNKIPARVILKFLQIYSDASDGSRLIDIPNVEIIERVKTQFSNYYFEQTLQLHDTYLDIQFSEKITLDSIIFELIDVVTEILEGFEQNRDPNEFVQRDDLFYCIYDFLNKKRNSLKAKSKKKFSLYAMGAMSAFICHELGYPFPTQKNPTIRDYYQSARNLISKYEKRGTKS